MLHRSRLESHNPDARLETPSKVPCTQVLRQRCSHRGWNGTSARSVYRKVALEHRKLATRQNKGKRLLEASSLKLRSSQHSPRDEDEQNAQGCGSQEGHQHGDQSTLVQELSDIGLADCNPVHKGVFTVAHECHEGVDLILVRDDEV